ncbi:hypothetical protein BC827DRAFT_596092 [Russula dissimulans]|nr:hypothetical protein BC827DRAFT_596092 [Russula dissimulans]
MSTPLFDTPRPMPSRLLSSLKRPFSKAKPEPYSFVSDRTREPGSRATPPTYEQITMGLHLSRTPHIPAHLVHLYPPITQPRLQRSVSSPASSAPHRAHKSRTASAHLHPSYSQPQSRFQSRSPTPSRSPSRSHTRLPPPPARSALKRPRVTATGTSSSMTPDTASSSTVASSILLSTPTSRSTRSGILTRFLGKERGAASTQVAIIAEPEPEPERKAVRFHGVEEEDESC